MATKKPTSPLDALVAAGPARAIALMLWQDRHRQPDMYRQITERDIEGLDACTAYLKAKPEVRIYRPEGLPATPGIPAQGRNRAVPARAATPPKPYVIVTLVDHRGDAIKPIENNEPDYDAQKEAALVQKARAQANELATRIVNQAQTGNTSLSDITDAANALLVLARNA